MSVAFSSVRPRSKGEVTQQTIQKMLDENHHLIQCIMDYQSKGKTAECTQYQQILHRNLVYLATIADSNQNMQSLLPAPPTPNMGMGPAGMVQGGGSALHTQSNLNDSMTTGLPASSSMMQSQMSNGPGHASMQQQSGQTQSALTSTSLNLPPSSHGGSAPSPIPTPTPASGYSHPVPSSQGSMIQGPGYASSSSSSSSRSNLNMQSNTVSMMHQPSPTPHYSSQAGGQHYQGQQAMGMMAQGSQGNSMMAQRPMGSYRPSQQGSAWHHMGQDECYGEQYGHTHSSIEPINQPHYPDGNHTEPYTSHVMESTRTSSLRTANRATRGPLTSPLNTTTKEVTLSIVSSSRPSSSRAQCNSNPSASSSTPLNRATVVRHRAMVQVRVGLPSIPSISRVSSTAPTALPRMLRGHRHRGPTPMNRVSMETISNKAFLSSWGEKLALGTQHSCLQTIHSYPFIGLWNCSRF